jgi:KDO2-lipid IV(A) lauroyltransferase
MKISHGLEYLAARLLALVFQLLPHGAAVALGGWLGRLIDRLRIVRHAVVIDNLRIAYGDAFTPARREGLSREVFDNLGKTMAEICRFPRISKEHIFALVDSEGSDVFREVAEYGKGGVLVGSHFGNWELMGGYVSALGYPIDFLVRGQHNRYFDQYLTYLRGCLGVRVIHSERDMKEVIRALKQNRQVAMVSDQHAGSQGIIVRFFGQPVSVPRAPAALAVRLGSPMVTGCIFRNPDNTHHCVFDRAIYPRPDADPTEEMERLTQLFTLRIEEAIRRRPELWLWTHRRFKHIPAEKKQEAG